MKGFPDARLERWLGALALSIISLITLEMLLLATSAALFRSPPKSFPFFC